MTQEYVKDKVRDFKATKEDAAKLAACFNSFDDSGSWPGGFTHGNPYTADRVLEDLKKTKNIRIIVAHTEEKIVGHCNVADGFMNEESAYVGLLGVDPAYQGQGFGKALLIEAAETAAVAGKRRLDLHTWGGNLKAMPLYKRVGYNWVPGTRVLMESHIPSILNCELFQDFFEKYYWYDSLKREIKQEIDDVVEDGIGIFKYHFEGENGDHLDVVIDREAKGICGFEKFLDDERIAVNVRPKIHTGYIGIGEVPVELQISNNTTDDVSYTVTTNTSDDIRLSIGGALSGRVPKGEKHVITGTYSIPFGVRHLDRLRLADEKATSQVEWSVVLNGKSFSLFSGLIPNHAVKVSTFPKHPSLTPGESKEIRISLENNMQSTFNGVIVITHSKDGISKPIEEEVSINENSGTEIAFTVESDSSSKSKLLESNISIYSISEDQRTKIVEKPLNIPVIGISGSHAFEGVEDEYILESESFRAIMSKYVPNMFTRIESKILDSYISGWCLLPDIGYPFPSNGSEWDRMQYDIDLQSSERYSEIILRGESKERLGLKVTTVYRIHAGTEHIDVTTKVENTGPYTHSNLGIRLGGWLQVHGKQMYVPLNGEIYSFTSREWTGGRQLPKKAEHYHEEWTAIEGHRNGMLIGYVWDSKDLVEVSPRRQWGMSRFEYKIPDLTPGESYTKKLLSMLVSDGSWRKVRALWARLTGETPLIKGSIQFKPDLDVSYVNTSGQRYKLESPIILPKGESEVEIIIEVPHESPTSASVEISVPESLLVEGKPSIKFEIGEIGFQKSFSKKIRFQVKQESDGWLHYGGETYIEFPSRIVRAPLTVIAYDENIDEILRKDSHEEMTAYVLESGEYSIEVCPEYRAALTRFGMIDEASVLLDRFPDNGPFLWWDKFYSGVTPYFVGAGVWDWESALRKEEWSIKQIRDDPWIGYELESLFKHSPGIKGMTAKVQYMILPGIPIVRSSINLTNTSKITKTVYSGFHGFPQPGESSQPIIHAVHQGRIRKYEPTENEMHAVAPMDRSWVAFEDPDEKTVLGVISTLKGKESLEFSNWGEQAERVQISHLKVLKPKESAILTCYLVISEEVQDVQKMKGLPEVLINE